VISFSIAALNAPRHKPGEKIFAIAALCHKLQRGRIAMGSRHDENDTRTVPQASAAKRATFN